MKNSPRPVRAWAVTSKDKFDVLAHMEGAFIYKTRKEAIWYKNLDGDDFKICQVEIRPIQKRRKKSNG